MWRIFLNMPEDLAVLILGAIFWGSVIYVAILTIKGNAPWKKW